MKIMMKGEPSPMATDKNNVQDLYEEEEEVNQSIHIEHGLITKIEQQKKNLRRYNIYINERFAFSVHEDILVTFRLLKGREISQTELEQIVIEEERKKAERAGLRFLSYRPRTTKEMRDYLLQKEYERGIIDSLLVHWQNIGYLDDLQFAKQWVEERVSFKHKGRNLVREELRHKGVPPTIIEQVLVELNDHHELWSCLSLINKKIKRAEQQLSYQEKQKLFQFLQRRGYPFDTIQQAYQTYLTEE